MSQFAQQHQSLGGVPGTHGHGMGLPPAGPGHGGQYFLILKLLNNYVKLSLNYFDLVSFISKCVSFRLQFIVFIVILFQHKTADFVVLGRLV